MSLTKVNAPVFVTMKFHMISTLFVVLACVIATVVGSRCICTDEYAPVCGSNNVVYTNKCRARCAGVGPPYNGNCPGLPGNSK